MRDRDQFLLPLDAFVRSIGVNRQIRHSFFLGAGASVSSGIPTAEHCLWQWKRTLFQSRHPEIEHQLTDPRGRFLVREDESRLGAEMLGVAHRHPRGDAERQRLLGGRHHVLVPATDDDRRPIQVRPPGELEVTSQTTADLRGCSSSS